ncbi:transcriptional regulator AsnC [Aliidiomarina shirensis]|uniref:Transcriptional regulator AsnC n=1 Tax=Aliidiomarina shirensis TaxID=1048642 RepID=A0A432WUA1_9GAMM|nr:transcriptional regulator AsnC [Aliidiomarina shirensis]RUO37350.1 transcriptional regulator AsnC [Aliidiomarina shirensis]
MIDNLDKCILNALSENARQSYAEIAKENGVSPATIHVRVEKLRKAGVITGTRLTIDPKKLGYDITCFIGITLRQAGDYPSTLKKLEALPEVTEAYYTTGQYSVLIKVLVRNIEDLQKLLIERLQVIDEIQSTETLISLQTPIQRSIRA